MTWVDEDAIAPLRIEHRCEALFDGDQLEEVYNYLLYEFGAGGRTYWARAYLDEIGTVSLYGPSASQGSRKRLKEPIAPEILAYLRRRFQTIQILENDGYVPLDDAD